MTYTLQPHIQKATNLVALLTAQAETRPDHPVFKFLRDGDLLVERMTFTCLDQRARAIAACLQAEGISPGSRALLLFPAGLAYIEAFFGCLYAGVVAVPAYPPRRGRDDLRLAAIVADAEPSAVLTTVAIAGRRERLASALPRLDHVLWLVPEQISGLATYCGDWRRPSLKSGHLAFLQYTSGSTADPKGVALSHGNLLHNQEMIRRAFGQTRKSVIVSWLPLYHDMGLIGNVIQPLYLGARCILMAPMAFLQKPLRWLRAVSRYRASTSGGPNFAYELCLQKIDPEANGDLDLSCWNVAFNGAEPVRAATLNRFAEAFAPLGFQRRAFFPCYGLAEATLFVAGGPKDADPLIADFDPAGLAADKAVPASTGPSRSLVSSGRLDVGQQVIIVGGDRERPQGEIGEIWVAGSSIARGYWRHPSTGSHAFGARLADRPREGPFLRTGDLGFVMDDALFVTGRLKDLIILRGRNHYPQDIEATAAGCRPHLKPGGGAAFSVDLDGEERLVVVHECRRGPRTGLAATIDAIRQAVAEVHDVSIYAVVLIRASTLPKTSSGKVRRGACRKAYLEDRLRVLQAHFLPEDGEPLVSFPEEACPGFLDDAAPGAKARLIAFLTRRAARAAQLAPSSIPADRPLTSLGFDSLAAIAFMNDVEQELGIAFSLPNLLDGVSIAELVRQLREGRGPTSEAALPSPAAPDRDQAVFELSHGQRALWFLQKLNPDTIAFHLVGAARVDGDLDVPALERALQAVVVRHPALRNTFGECEGEPFQRVRETMAVSCRQETCGTLKRAAARLEELAFQPFDLGNGPLLRTGLLHGSAGERLMFLAVHHLITDFWSLGLLLREWEAFYRQETSSPRAERAPQIFSYRQYVLDQREKLSSQKGEAHWQYWRDQLANLPILELPTDQPRPPIRSTRGAFVSAFLDPVMVAELERLARANRSTLYVVLLAAFQVLLQRYSGQDDFAIGSPTTGRGAAKWAEVMGYFIGPVVLRANLGGDPDFGEVLARTRLTVLEAFAHQDFPFPLLAERLQPEPDPSRSPLFQVFFVMEQARLLHERGLSAFALGDTGARMELFGLPFESLRLSRRDSQFDLMFLLARRDGGLGLSLEYNPDLFDVSTIHRMLGHYRRLLAAVANYSSRKLRLLPMLTAAERSQVLIEWQRRNWDCERPGVLQQRFEHWAARTPRAVAAVHEVDELTYGQLNERANRLAHRLREYGVGPEIRVGLCLDRSLDLLVALLAILKAGGTYVPLDPTYPRRRLAFLLADAFQGMGQAVVITRSEMAPNLPDLPQIQLLLLDGFDGSHQAFSSENLPVQGGGDGLAYIIYTSGSTGRPKGVGVTHHNVLRLFDVTRGPCQIGPRDIWTLFHSPAFDFSVWEIWGALAHGGMLVVVPWEVSRSPELFWEVLVTEEVTVLNQTPSAFRQLIHAMDPQEAQIPALRLIIFGGEALDPKDLEPWFQRYGVHRPCLVNMYGITETTVHATWKPIPGNEPAPASPVGRPLADLDALLLDRFMNPLPMGVSGEIYIGGPGLARGYFQRPELTAARFVPHPFRGEPGSRLYRSGDLARFYYNGEMAFWGRTDRQVKIRGFRIELGEIQTRLRAHPQVREAFVTVLGKKNPRLVAYFTGRTGDVATLREHLQAELPDYMTPAFIVKLESMPLTPHGKLDTRRLPDPGQALPSQEKTHTAPRTEVERRLASCWSEVLEVDRFGIHENFFELGGHSLLATRVMSRIERVFGLTLPLRELFSAPTVAGLAARIEASLGRNEASAAPPIRPIPRDGQQLALSFTQQRLWFLNRLQPQSPAYNMPAAFRLAGCLDVFALEIAFRELCRRHEVLRTNFVARESGPSPVIDAVPLPAIKVLNSCDLAKDTANQWQERLVREEAALPFDLARDALLRITVLQIPKETLLLVTLHHIVADGWSLGILKREVAAFYRSTVTGVPVALRELPIQFADYAVWQRQGFQGEKWERQLTYWQTVLVGAPPLLSLSCDRPRPAVQSFAGAVEPFWVDLDLSRALERLARDQGATLFMVLETAFACLLARYSGQEDVCLGTPVANRNQAETEALIGCFINTLVLRHDLSHNARFTRLLARARQAALAAFAHQDLPFERVVEALRPERNLGHTPLFQAMFILQNAPGDEMTIPGLNLQPLAADAGIAKFDLTLTLSERDRGLMGTLEYNRDLYERESVVVWIESFLALLRAITAQPGLRFAELVARDAATARRLLEETHAPGPRLGADLCIQQLVARQEDRKPDVVALVGAGVQLTYRELGRQARCLARHLRTLGCVPGVLAGVCLERGPELMVALLAVLETGAAYVPLDPAFPRQRLAHILEDAETPLVLVHRQTMDVLPAVGPRLVDIGASFQAEEKFLQAPQSEGPAYVIYTSGSTGRPKGVVVAHGAAVNFLLSMAREPGMTPQDTLLAVTTVSFDIALLEFFLPLSVGARLVVAGREQAADPVVLRTELDCHGVTVMQATPVTWRMLVESGWQGEADLKMLCGGEALTAELAGQLLERGRTLYNLYGPTETTVWSAVREIGRASEQATEPIGGPIAATRLTILGEDLGLVPPGAPGELYIGGAGLAQAYRNRPGLTAERFVPCPFVDDPGTRPGTIPGARPGARPGTRLYRTGDQVRRLLSGAIAFLGRLDQQVKLRGFRIELGDIEAALRQHQAVAEAVVTVRQAGGPRLVAYFKAVVDAEVSEVMAEIRHFLKDRLPAYMIPNAFVKLTRFPLTPNGKIDRRALPEPEMAPGATFAPPRTPLEELMAEQWRELLKLERVGIHDDFFELGGHSLLATRVVLRLEAMTGIALPLRELFGAPTVAELSARIEAAMGGEDLAAAATIRAMPRDRGPLPLSFTQQRLWFLNRLEPQSSAYHMPAAFRLVGLLDNLLLEEAFRALIIRHEVLRTRFVTRNGGPALEFNKTPSMALKVLDLRGLAHETQTRLKRRLVRAEAALPFNLAADSLLRVTSLHTKEGFSLLVTLHHIIADGWSLGIMIREVTAFYQTRITGRIARLPELPIQFADYAMWQRQWLTGEVLKRQLAFWRQALTGAPSLLTLPCDRSRSAGKRRACAQEPIRIKPEWLHALQSLGRRQGATLFMIFESAFAVLLARYSDQEEVCVGTPVANRNHAQSQSLIGCFVNTIVLRHDLTKNPAFTQVLARTRQTALDAFAHQDVPFERVVEALRPERNLGHTPLFQAMFILQNAPMGEVAIPGLSLQLMATDTGVAKFDLTLTIAERAGLLEATLEYNRDLFKRERVIAWIEAYRDLLATHAAKPEATLSEWMPRTALKPGVHPGKIGILPTKKHRGYTAPRNPGEEILAALWGEALQVKQVGIHDDFFELGGHSLLAVRMMSRVEEAMGVVLPLRELFAAPTIAKLAARVEAARGGGEIGAAFPPVRAMPRDTNMPLSFTQQRLWFLNRLEPHSPAYNMPAGYRLNGWLDPAALEAAFQDLGLRHEVLRTRFANHDGEPGQNFDTAPVIAVKILDLNGLVLDPQSLEERLARAEAALPFDLERDALLRVTILQDPVGSVLLLTLHHIVADGWSLGILIREVAALYRARMTGVSGRLRALTVQFADYAVWQHRCLRGKRLKRLLAFWEQALSGAPPLLTLPYDRPRPATPTYAGSLEPFLIESETSAALERLGRDQGVTPFMVLESAFACLLAHYSGQEEICVGTPVANRNRETEPLIGCFINTLVLRHDLSGNPRIHRVLARARQTALNAFAHQDLPFERVVEALRPERNLSHAPLFQVLFILQNAPLGDVAIPGLNFRPLATHTGIAKFDITLTLAETANGLEGTLEYNRDLFQRERVLTWIESYRNFLAAIATHPDGRLTDLLARVAGPSPPQGISTVLPAKIPKGPAHMAPRTAMEALLTELWREILGVKQVGIHDDFFELGGHSLLATRVLARIEKRLGVTLPLHEFFAGPTAAELTLRVETALNGEKPGSAPPPMRAIPRDQPLPLSFTQQRLWFLNRLEPRSPAYNMPAAFRLEGPLAMLALQAAFHDLWRRHEILRTNFEAREGEPVQVLDLLPPPEIKILDLRATPGLVERFAREEAAQPFDLARDALLRVTVLQAPNQTLLLVTLHHIIADGWSLNILIGETAALYRALVTDLPVRLPALPIQFADFAVWQRQWLQGEVLERQLAYWRKALAGVPSLLSMPCDRPRSTTQGYRGAVEPFLIEAALVESLNRLARNHRATLFMVLETAFACLLARYSGQEDICVGSPVANRNHAETEPLIGCFINTLVLRHDLSGNPRFTSLLARARQTVLDGFAHQDVPFERVVESLRPERNLGHAPLFQAMFILQNASNDPVTIPGLSFQPLAVDTGIAKFDLTLTIIETEAGAEASIEYNRDLFERETVKGWMEAFVALLDAVVAQPERCIGAWSPLDADTARRLVEAHRGGDPSMEAIPCFFQWIEAQAARMPDSVAIAARGCQGSYRELAQQTRRLASHLRALGCSPGVLVGVCLERGPELVAALLAVLQTGAAYVPLDPAFPSRRLAHILEDAQTPLVLVHDRTQSIARALGVRVVNLDQPWETRRVNLPPVLCESPAYVIYTSGSTGRPKGVVIGHGAAANFLWSMAREPGMSPRDNLLAVTTVSFDIALLELFLPLITGGRLVVAAREQAADAAVLKRELVRQAITVMQATPATWRMLVASGWQGKADLAILCGGEALAAELAGQLLERGRALYNLYGPTETTVWSGVRRIRQRSIHGTEPIGGPIAATRLVLMGKYLELTPPGAPGELFIGGSGLAQAYRNRPCLTGERFVPNPFGDEPGTRLYRTGDLARYLRQGGIAFLGRLDHQVKLRGFRIELGDIEAALRHHPAVADAVVALHQDEDRRLVAYLRPVDQVDQPDFTASMRGFLASRLPAYMIPGAFVVLERFPLTPNGKVDRQALPAPVMAAGSGYMPPRTPLEERLAELWRETLGLERVGIHDDFFELGGHSLLATRLVARLEELFDITLSLNFLFQHPTIAALADHMESFPQKQWEAPENEIGEEEEEMVF